MHKLPNAIKLLKGKFINVVHVSVSSVSTVMLSFPKLFVSGSLTVLNGVYFFTITHGFF